ncbi:diacylglycerol/lipid kinase family protein [Cohaesibacter celericrescens]|nr:diacylglycerol kinase family protein [Cohaesibacter celericrescens]
MPQSAKKLVAFLNTDSGTLRSLDIQMVEEKLESCFVSQGYQVEIHRNGGKQLIELMTKKAGDPELDILLAAGGDGTISAAASLAWRHGKTLAVVPAGTMNLYARSLDLPLDVEGAIEALAKGQERKVDIATANDHAFVHQLSIGLHPTTVIKRKNYSYQSRFGKMLAGIRAYLDTIRHMPCHALEMTIDGVAKSVRLSSLSVSNNLFEQTAPPRAEKPDGGVLGVYMAGNLSRKDALALAADTLIGKMQDNSNMLVSSGSSVQIKRLHKGKPAKSVLDGELWPVPDVIDIKIHPKALSVLAVPAQ